MKRIIFVAFILLTAFTYNAKPAANPFMVDLARAFSRDIFEMNGVPYMEPVVQVVNAVSNSRFFSSAYIPKYPEKPYFKISLNGMLGFVPEGKKWYTPKMPNEQVTTEGLIAGNYASIVPNFLDPAKSQINILDTAGLIFYVFKGMIYNGLHNGSLNAPTKAATALGNYQSYFLLPNSVLKDLLHNLSIEVPILGSVKLYDYLPQNMKDSLDGILGLFPEKFTLPPGSDLSTMFAAVPQLEIGSFMGTELLIRFIPPVDMGETVGDFAFWGFGLRHSISQYFNWSDKPENRIFDLAVQAVYQGTSLSNKIGVTGADLKANATMWDLNIHASKSFVDIIDLYTGFSMEFIDIKTEYTYVLPVELQKQLGLMRDDPTTGTIIADPPLYPGDTNPQRAEMSLKDTNYKWVIGASRQIGNFAIHADFSMSKINMFTFGLEYKI
jgi:hypothetical protein